MQETVIKVGHPPDFVMSRAKMEYFHTATVSLFNSEGFCLDARRFSFRSFKTLTDNTAEFIGSRIQKQPRKLNVNSKSAGLFLIESRKIKIEIIYRWEEFLSETNKKTLLSEMESFLECICAIAK